jgi:4-oxalocrotonate tautomerase
MILMPHVSVKLYPGRSETDKAELARAIAKDVTAILKCGDDSVSVAIEDVPPGDWIETVYKPEIASKADKLFKKPGYGSLQSGG